MMLAIGTAAYAQKVSTDSDPAAPFATFTTYAWTTGTPSPNGLAEQRIHAAVDAQLAAKGLMLVQSNPTMFVATHVMTHQQQQVVANGFGPWGFSAFGPATIETYVQGTLIVDLYNAATKKMVWRGVATGTASDKASKNTEKIDRALVKMFERYPPVGAN
jgi:hypothetical protein